MASKAMRGFLTKRGEKNKFSWKRRFFEVQSQTMVYYEAESREKEIGRLSLSDAIIRHAPDCKRPFAFEIVTGSRVWQFSAENDAERDAWMEYLLQVAGTESDANQLISRAEALIFASCSDQVLQEATEDDQGSRQVDGGGYDDSDADE
eukprot:m.83845 g.83845  ORF g.83845 m.83845 type:complete len:149 (+) comp14993_c0_seq1:435-881(+)